MDSQQIAALWVQRLAARGVSLLLRKNRLWLEPANAYSSLTDDELLTLRHHREAIKEVVRSTTTPRDESPRIADDAILPPGPRAENQNQKQIFCSYCNRASCVNNADIRRVLHWNDPIEVAKRRESATTEMHVMLQRRRGDD